MPTINNKIELSFATVEFYKNYLVCSVKPGESIGINRVVELHKMYRAYFGKRRYGYIFDRTTDYTINPISYMECPYYPDVTAFAIVAPNPETKKTVLFEEKFSKKELKMFDTLIEAKQWMEAFNKELGL